MTTQPATINLKRRRFSVDEYHQLAEVGILSEQDKVELIHGEIIEMSPIGPKHSGNLDRLSQFLTLFFRDAAIVRVQSPVQLGSDSEPEPDLSVLKARNDFYTTSHPQAADILLVVEFFDSSLNYDQNVKLPLYAIHNIPEAWIIDLQEDRVLVFQDPKGEAYLSIHTYQRGDSIASSIQNLEISVDELLG